MTEYYKDKINSLRDLFGAAGVELRENAIAVDGKLYPVVDDVIILLRPECWTEDLKRRIGLPAAEPRGAGTGAGRRARNNEPPAHQVPGAMPPGPGTDCGECRPVPAGFAEDIQYTFGKEWLRYPEILPEHAGEFKKYFDLVDTDALASSRVCDLGCGIGRWSYFLRNKARELVLLDFSEAIFVARKNLHDARNALFFMGDIKELPFRENFADLIFSLGVLHHLPTNALDEVRALARYSKRLLIFLYYALDNRPRVWRAILYSVTLVRLGLSRIKCETARAVLTGLITFLVYLPLIYLGKALAPAGLGKYVPLYDFYHDKTVKRIKQDVYDRFFTRIEHRYTRAEIAGLNDTFREVRVSEDLPYWHFLCVN
ncbi:MAG: hypothetical protein FD189_261 [Elusimicrobia bacterium]|nr:MAG: hypothetical protein FD154_61 [Elusimicrobiota bacterium]KAF0157994.1 MAG: hypothetical protein FD189_261 [Elusimicrobiota bacterium]